MRTPLYRDRLVTRKESETVVQQTISLKVSPAKQKPMRATLEESGFEFRDLSYAFWQARTDGAVVSFYRSGKLVIQGKDATMVEAMLGLASSGSRTPGKPQAQRSGEALPNLKGPYGAAMAKHPLPTPHRWIGIDEAGKGDYFGPLVVAAALVETSQLGWLHELGVGDSKRIPDSRIIELDYLLRNSIPHSVVVLMPETYNRLYGDMKNLNILLAWGHATAASDVLKEHDAELILSDQFTRSNHVPKALKSKQITVPYTQRTKAEDDPAVAVASIFARAAFVRGIRSLSKESGVKVPLGAGSPIPPAGRKLVAKYGPDCLDRYAKTHFKTTKKILG